MPGNVIKKTCNKNESSHVFIFLHVKIRPIRKHKFNRFFRIKQNLVFIKIKSWKNNNNFYYNCNQNNLKRSDINKYLF